MVKEITAGDILGDVDLLGRHPYRSRIEAGTPLTVWQIDAPDLDRLLHRRAHVRPRPGARPRATAARGRGLTRPSR